MSESSATGASEDGAKDRAEDSTDGDSRPVGMFFCELCGVDMTGPKNFNDHLTGKKHRSKMLEPKASNSSNADKSTDPNLKDSEKVHCKVCNLYTIGVKNFHLHLEGKKHKSKVARLPPDQQHLIPSPPQHAPAPSTPAATPEPPSTSSSDNLGNRGNPDDKDVFYCGLCDCSTTGAFNFSQHLAGKKHIQCETIQPGPGHILHAIGYGESNPNTIRKYFQQFGTIHKLQINHVKEVVEVIYVDEASVAKLQMRLIHLLGKHQLVIYVPKEPFSVTERITTAPKVTPGFTFYCDKCDVMLESRSTYSTHMSSKNHFINVHNVENDSACGITVSNYSNLNKDNLLNHFSKFGKIATATMVCQNQTTDVIFSERAGRDAALATSQHYVCDQAVTVGPLQVRPKRKRDAAREKVQEQVRADLTVAARQIVSQDTVFGQIEKLLELVPLKEDARQKRIDLINEMEAELRRFIPEVKLKPYGSLVTGLGSQHGDIDIIVGIDPRIDRDKITQRPYTLPDLSVLPNLEVQNGMVTLESLLGESDSNVLVFFMMCLTSSRLESSITKMRPILSAKVPVLKFTHKPLNIQCDITFGTSLSVTNTNFLVALQHLDDRFLPLVHVVRFWARQVGVISDEYRMSISSYALTLMVYFYLENTSPPVLPTLQTMETFCQLEDRCTVQDWDCSFPSVESFLQKSNYKRENFKSTPELLEGFFDFYANLDLFNGVISPRTGQFIRLMEFRQKIADDRRMDLFGMKDLNLQDPFELNHNILGHVLQTACRGIISEEFIKAAVKIRCAQNWTLKSFIPIGTYCTPTHPPPKASLYDGLVFHFQMGFLPMGFSVYGSTANIEAQWHQWIVELAMKALSVLRVEHHMISEYDKSEELFPLAEYQLPDVEWADPLPPRVRGASKPESGEKRKADKESSAAKKKKKRAEVDMVEIDVYKHPSLSFKVERVLKEETLLKCRTFHKVWNRAVGEFDLSPADYDNEFKYQEAVTEKIMENPFFGKASFKNQAEFIARFRRYSHAHNTYMEVDLEKHNLGSVPPFILDKIKKHIRRMISTVISSNQ